MAIQINGTSGISGVDGSAATPALQGSDSNTGISFGTDTVSINTGGTARATVDSSGRLGIGTTSPSQLLEINDASTPSVQIKDTTNNVIARIGANDNTALVGTRSNHPTVFQINDAEVARLDASGRLLVGKSSSIGANPRNVQSRNGYSVVTDLDEVCGEIQIWSSAQNSLWIHADPDNLRANSSIEFSVDGTDRMRIASNGESSIYASDTVLNCRTASTSSTADVLVMRNGASSTSTGTVRFSVKGDGDCENTNNSYTGFSDIKLKENIVDAPSQWDDLKALRVRSYNFKEETTYGTHKQIGLVAQEVELVSPGLVKESPDRDENGDELGTTTKSVKYSILYMKAVKALQEAMERIESLEARLTTLEGGTN